MAISENNIMLIGTMKSAPPQMDNVHSYRGSEENRSSPHTNDAIKR